MNNEETKVLNQSEETVVMNKATEEREETVVENTEATATKKKSGFNDKVAYAVGGFAAGLAGGVAGSAFAASPEEADVAAVVATDDGVRIAHVDDNDSFAEAFADARAQVGPGGAFEWRGHVYNTYYAEEWNSMSAEERAEYQSKIDYEDFSDDIADNNELTPTIEGPEVDMDVLEADVELLELTDDNISVLGVEAVVDDYGNPMTVAVIESGNEQALLVDVDNDGTMDLIIADDNHDGQIDPYVEVGELSGDIETDDLMRGMATEMESDMYMAYNDDMPDYMNDADVSAMA